MRQTLDAIFAGLFATCMLSAALPALAQTPEALFPTKPLRFMIGFGPGGSTDLMSRMIALKLAERLGQPVVAELRSGASGTIAADAVAKAPPDGHTLILLTGAHPVTGVLMRSLPFDPVRDLAMVSTVVSYPIAIVVVAGSPFRSIEDLLALARSEPRKVSFGTAGIGSGQHLIGEWIGVEAGLEFLHVPFRSGSASLTELLAGRIDMTLDTLTSALPQIRAGKTRALAVTTRESSRFLPEVPPIARVVPQVDFSSWAGVATTGGTPPAIVARLNRDGERLTVERGVVHIGVAGGCVLQVTLECALADAGFLGRGESVLVIPLDCVPTGC